jgi:hypothetical protein
MSPKRPSTRGAGQLDVRVLKTDSSAHVYVTQAKSVLWTLSFDIHALNYAGLPAGAIA